MGEPKFDLDNLIARLKDFTPSGRERVQEAVDLWNYSMGHNPKDKLDIHITINKVVKHKKDTLICELGIRDQTKKWIFRRTAERIISDHEKVGVTIYNYSWFKEFELRWNTIYTEMILHGISNVLKLSEEREWQDQ